MFMACPCLSIPYLSIIATINNQGILYQEQQLKTLKVWIFQIKGLVSEVVFGKLHILKISAHPTHCQELTIPTD